ncbi:hypothetical protein B0H11DRAFT_2223724 [Mycena galericulata]|nr:hypothetical protein B0H11DRAFT_2223724 [Mycena galericulata]
MGNLDPRVKYSYPRPRILVTRRGGHGYGFWYKTVDLDPNPENQNPNPRVYGLLMGRRLARADCDASLDTSRHGILSKNVNVPGIYDRKEETSRPWSEARDRDRGARRQYHDLATLHRGAHTVPDPLAPSGVVTELGALGMDVGLCCRLFCAPPCVGCIDMQHVVVPPAHAAPTPSHSTPSIEPIAPPAPYHTPMYAATQGRLRPGSLATGATSEVPAGLVPCAPHDAALLNRGAAVVCLCRGHVPPTKAVMSRSFLSYIPS